MRLLRMRYGRVHLLVEVPDRDRGDLGLEAFTHTGVAFQCYAAEDPLSVRDLYENQRDKLTRDLGKLRANHKALEKLFGPVKIRQYVLLVPENLSKELVAHASAKTSEVRKWELSFIAEDFTITIETDQHYQAERRELFALPDELISILPVADADREDWGEQNEPLLSDARRKLSAIGLTSNALDSYLEVLLEQYLTSTNALEELRRLIPENWEAVVRAQSRHENVLVLEYPAGSTKDALDVKTIAADVQNRLRAAVPSLTEDLARTFAWGAVADWIFRCPLEFEARA